MFYVLNLSGLEDLTGFCSPFPITDLLTPPLSNPIPNPVPQKRGWV